MDVRHFSGRTVEAYVAGVKGLAKYYMRAPDQLSDDEVQRYLRDERQLSRSSCNQIRCALKLFYEVTVRRPQPSLTVPPMSQAQKPALQRLPADVLVRELGRYYEVYGRPEHWVFPQRHNRSRHLDVSSAQKIYTTAKRRAGVGKVGGIHSLRHAFSTHSLEAGLDLPTLGRLLGHTSVTTTMRYLHTTGKRVSAQISPLDRLLFASGSAPTKLPT